MKREANERTRRTIKLSEEQRTEIIAEYGSLQKWVDVSLEKGRAAKERGWRPELPDRLAKTFEIAYELASAARKITGRSSVGFSELVKAVAIEEDLSEVTARHRIVSLFRTYRVLQLHMGLFDGIVLVPLDAQDLARLRGVEVSPPVGPPAPSRSESTYS